MGKAGSDGGRSCQRVTAMTAHDRAIGGEVGAGLATRHRPGVAMTVWMARTSPAGAVGSVDLAVAELTHCVVAPAEHAPVSGEDAGLGAAHGDGRAREGGLRKRRRSAAHA